MDEPKEDHVKVFFQLMNEFLADKEREAWDSWCDIVEARRKIMQLKEVYGTQGSTENEEQ